MPSRKKPSTTKRGSDFEREVEQLLRLKGYHVERNVMIHSTQIDLVARMSDSLNNIKLIVECGNHAAPVGVDVVKQKAAILLSPEVDAFIYRLLYVARNGFTADAKAFAASNPRIVLRTARELEQELIDFQPYTDWYMHNYERSDGMFREARLARNYVELAARTEEGELHPSLTKALREWLTTTEDNVLFLLGEFGAGKTSFCRQLIYVMLGDRNRDLACSEPIPILINLREYRSGAPNMQQIVTDTLVNEFGVRLSSFQAFQKFADGGRVALVLDGFDEMADRADFQTLVACFQQIFILAVLNVKIVVTCRSNVFQSHADVVNLLKRFSISLRLDDGRLDVPLNKHGRIWTVAPLSDAQIQEFVRRRFGSEADTVVRQMRSIHDLSDLSTRPVLLDMILTTLPQLAAAGRINSAALYETYTNRWTERDNWRVAMPLEVRTGFCDVLAMVMHQTRIEELGYEKLQELLVRSLHDLAHSDEQLDRFKHDIQTCSFLVRAGSSSSFRFAHKSFLEFFVARRIVNLLLTGADIGKETQNAEEKPAHGRLNAYWVLVGGAGASTLDFSHILGSFSERLRTHDPLIEIMRNKAGGSLPVYRSEETLRQHLQERMDGVLTQEAAASGGQTRIPVTEEIATFAAELLENRGGMMKAILVTAESADAVVLLAEVIRLAKAAELVRSNLAFVEDYIAWGQGRTLLKVAFASAVAKLPGLMTYELLMKIRAAVPEDGWRYVLYELAEQPARDRELLRRCAESGDSLPLFDRLICMHGLRDSIPLTMSGLATEELFEELMRSENEQHQLLALRLCGSLSDSADSSIRLIARVWDRALSPRVREEAVGLLSLLQGKTAWMAIRSLWQREQDARLRIRLRNAEKIVRDNTSAKRSRVTWDQARSHKTVRDAMWTGLS